MTLKNINTKCFKCEVILFYDANEDSINLSDQLTYSSQKIYLLVSKNDYINFTLYFIPMLQCCRT